MSGALNRNPLFRLIESPMKIIEVIADVSYQDIITTIADQHEALD